MKTKNAIFGSRMVNVNTPMPQVMLDQIQELIDVVATQGIYMNRSSAIRYIIERFLKKKKKEE